MAVTGVSPDLADDEYLWQLDRCQVGREEALSSEGHSYNCNAMHAVLWHAVWSQGGLCAQQGRAARGGTGLGASLRGAEAGKEWIGA
eukprot:2028340-Rhodomonas_salina.1